jgi:hypothetical protein
MLAIYKGFFYSQKVAQSVGTTPNKAKVTSSNHLLVRTCQKTKVFLDINYEYGDEEEILDN